MRILSMINLKGGVSKTTTSINMAHILSTIQKKKVLLIDNDKQGNVSKFFNVHSYSEDECTIADILINRELDIKKAIHTTPYPKLDVISANMNLINANLRVTLDQTRSQQTIFKIALKKIEEEYDYCIFDCAPDINISIINSLVASDDVIIPIKIDKFSFDGLEQLEENIYSIKEAFNPDLNIAGCLVTQYQRNKINRKGIEWLKDKTSYPVFETLIRKTEKVDESTFEELPIQIYSPRCGAAKDYCTLVEEYLLNVSHLDRGRE